MNRFISQEETRKIIISGIVKKRSVTVPTLLMMCLFIKEKILQRRLFMTI